MGFIKEEADQIYKEFMQFLMGSYGTIVAEMESSFISIKNQETEKELILNIENFVGQFKAFYEMKKKGRSTLRSL